MLQPPELDMRDSSSEKCSFAETLPFENEQVESFEDGCNQSDFFFASIFPPHLTKLRQEVRRRVS